MNKPWILAYAHIIPDLIENETEQDIPEITHPEYDNMIVDWNKWRFTMEGGDNYVEQFVKQFSKLEDPDEFAARKAITPIPAFAKSSVIDIKNAIFQRLIDVKRADGPASYRNVIDGSNLGVNLLGDSMDSFIGRIILPELLSMGKVGIYVDMPLIPDNLSVADRSADTRPYIYMYQTEDIRSWAWQNINERSELSALLLRDRIFAVDPITRLPVEEKERFRWYWIDFVDGKPRVFVQFFDDDGNKILPDGMHDEQSTIMLDIPKIPFIILELSNSLLTDIANHQIALVNLSSSDINYAVKSNFPFYTEQFDPRWESANTRGPAPGTNTGAGDEAKIAAGATGTTGAAAGRKYPKGLERPQFIHPSSEPLTVSIEKQEQLKKEIRQLMNLNISNLQPTRTSGEARAYDERPLESGLSYIGLELEYGERRIESFWAMYEGVKSNATIVYPQTYSLRTIAERRTEAESLDKIKETVPSKTFRSELTKKQADITIGTEVSLETMEKINSEIDAADAPSGNVDAIQKDVEMGLVSVETASQARGYQKGEVTKAKADHAERLARIKEAQTAVDPEAQDAQTNRDDKAGQRDTDEDDVPTDKTRGNADGS